MRNWVIAAVLVVACHTQAQAQQPFVYKPIDTDKLVVQPTNTVANATTGTIGGTLRTIGSTVANTIEDNGFVRTFNNLLGRRATPAPVQAGFSALPPVSSYQSTRYNNSFKPRVPLNSTYGSSVTFPKER
jgi:hypothetical protein